VVKEPDIINGRRMAWNLRSVDAMVRKGEYRACLGAWLVHWPGGHPCWSYWLLSVVHLRPIAGQSQEPALHFPDAAYEFSILSVDPILNPYLPDESEGGGYFTLVPPDLICQVAANGFDDAHAEKVGLEWVVDLVRGPVSPDQDFSSYWKHYLRKRFGQAP